MNVAAEPITLLVENLEAKINRFIKNAPENVPFSEEEIMNLVKETRNNPLRSKAFSTKKI